MTNEIPLGERIETAIDNALDGMESANAQSYQMPKAEQARNKVNDLIGIKTDLAVEMSHIGERKVKQSHIENLADIEARLDKVMD